MLSEYVDSFPTSSSNACSIFNDVSRNIPIDFYLCAQCSLNNDDKASGQYQSITASCMHLQCKLLNSEDE